MDGEERGRKCKSEILLGKVVGESREEMQPWKCDRETSRTREIKTKKSRTGQVMDV